MPEQLERKHQRYLVARGAMTTHLIEDRRASVSPWGLGNSKVGPGVYTYSKPSGRAGSCRGSTDYCERICYAKRMNNPWLDKLYAENSARGAELPELPEDAKLVRGHVSGDFDTGDYVRAWARLVSAHPDCLFWFYTRAWRIDALLPSLEDLRALANVQVFASMDPDCETPPEGWRRAWLDSDERAIHKRVAKYAFRTVDGVLAVACPEETGKKANCVECGYCFRPGRGDVLFLEHRELKG